MNEASRKFFIILLGAVGITLLVMVGHNMVTIYRGSMSDVEENESRTISCHQMFFDVAFNDENELEVVNNRISSYDLDELTFVDIDTSERETKELFVFRPGDKREVDVSDINSTEFAVFPFDCEPMAKVCSREKMTCVSYEDWQDAD
ncbi:MAG: hypothetical protein ACLFNK_02530 [Candidatus Woesearchaeota archaeon]